MRVNRDAIDEADSFRSVKRLLLMLLQENENLAYALERSRDDVRLLEDQLNAVRGENAWERIHESAERLWHDPWDPNEQVTDTEHWRHEPSSTGHGVTFRYINREES